MSHLDELDEFEAELEISLKREYSAVFGLFRYCVLTQDATYLCNQLDVESLPQASYPFFHVRMEDVWVWDKNRPTRIIPRAEVYTSGDVTIEELRGEGEEPRLTAEALAERIGQQFPGDDENVVARQGPVTRYARRARRATARSGRAENRGTCDRSSNRDLFAKLEQAEVEHALRVADVLVSALGRGPMRRSRRTAYGGT